jgi:hypothetical protein
LISIIICSRDRVARQKLIDNITRTIGVLHEILVYDNGLTNSSICSVYNCLLPQSKYPFVVCLHEDLFFHTQAWGQIISNILSKQEVGLLGLSGSVYKSRFQGVWSAAKKSTYRLSTEDLSVESQSNYLFYKVAIVDGCFLAARKETFQLYSFDENLKGFHGYDIDISIQVGKHFQVVVAKGINFEHFSNGNQNLDWLQSSLYVHRKWENVLPVKAANLDKSEVYLSDYLSAQNLYNAVYDLKYSYQLVLKYYLLFITRFFVKNGFRYTKKTLTYFLRS